jgi:hypothetical protein
LRQKQDVTLNLYSLRGWDFTRTALDIPDETPLGKAIDGLNNIAIRAFYSSSFFRYSLLVPQESNLCRFVSEELPKKRWLMDLSAEYTPMRQSVAHLLGDRPSLFNSVRDLDVSQAYSYMQYMEGYYLIREAVAKALNQDLPKAQVAFVLPNDEGKYYKDMPEDLELMLRADFDRALDNMDIEASFLFFRYGAKLAERPYFDRSKGAHNVELEEIPIYLPAAEMVEVKERACL